MTDASILIVEDEDKIAQALEDYLRQAGYRTHRLARGDEVEPWLRTQTVDLILLDLMLPGRSGLDICRALRSGGMHGGGPSILMITARVEEIDRLLGLEMGADDYICKPFSPREVVARVNAAVRRTRALQSDRREGEACDAQARPEPAAAWARAGLDLDDAGWKARLDGCDLALTAVEYQLLRVLVGQPGRIFRREQLMDLIYRDDRVVSERTIDSHVKKVRRKIQEVRAGSELIQSVYGVGYKFEPEGDGVG